MNDLTGKVVVVTGGSRGIGRAIVEVAAARGAQVMYCARSQPEDLGIGGVASCVADVSKEADVDGLFDRVRDTFGRLDIVVSNAAISVDNLAVQMSTEQWDEVIDTDLTGAFLIARRAARDLIAQGDGGHLVFVGSISQHGAISQANYAAAKAGVVGLCRSIAKELLPHEICANVVVPGYVKTDMSDRLPDAFKKVLVDFCPLKRTGTVEEIAEAALFAARLPASAYTGQVLYATGGLTEVPA